MSTAKLERAIDVLPPKIGPAEVAELSQATGERVGNKERRLLERLLTDHYQRFTADGLFALELLTGKAAPTRAPTVWRIGERHPTGVEEGSALAFLSRRHGFLVVDDETSVLWAVSAPNGDRALEKTALREDDGQLKGLEGVAVDHAASAVLTVSENRCTVHELALDLRGAKPKLGRPKLLGRLPAPLGSANKGWEGLGLVPPPLTPDKRPRLIAVQEGDPPMAFIFPRQPAKAGGEFKKEAEIHLPPEVAARMPDLSDLCFDPQTGHLYLLSDEGRAIYECALGCTTRVVGGQPVTTWGVVPIGATPLPELDGKVRFQAEGITFDADGDLHVLGEGRTTLLTLHRG